MAIAPKLEFKQSQNLAMTPQLRQAINLLQMSNVELNELLAEELNSNPLLEREDTNDEVDNNPYSKEEDSSSDLDSMNSNDDFASDREGYETDDNYSWDDYNKSKSHSDEEDFDYFEKKLRHEKSLYEIIEEQVNLSFANNEDKMIAMQLVNNLDEAGYFRGDLKEISTKLGIKISKTQSILNQLKTFEPSGIFAESLSECLKIQLQEKNRLDPIISILLDNLELLASRNLKELKRLCNCDDEDLFSMISDIKSLNPKPAAEFHQNFNTYIIPDVFVRTNKYGDYIVELNQMSLPRILLNKEYSKTISSSKNKDSKKFYKDKLSSASFLIKALSQRANTILSVSEEIIKYQRDFFEKGISYLKPMSMKDIAEKIEMHESTVSRVTTNKYMQTPRGLFELKYFFTQALNGVGSADDTSSLSIKHRIKELIEKEDKSNILSDDKLVELLAMENIKIARRTVAKYRETMGIATSAERKRTKRNQI